MSEVRCCMISDKTKYRSKFKEVRKNIQGELRSTKEREIKDNLFKFINLYCNNIKNVFIYNSFGSEVETNNIIDVLLKNKITILIPKCNEVDETMYATVYNSEKKQTVNSYGITEVEESNSVESKIDLIIAPGIVFDRFGTRIGFGKGYYDKFISSLNYKTMVIALAFSEQVVDEKLYRDNYDCKMDFIITDKEIIMTS